MGRIREILHRAYRDLRAVVSASTPSEEVALLNLSLVAWSECEAEGSTDHTTPARLADD